MNTSTVEELYTKACAHARGVSVLSAVESLLHWDERTMMPTAASDFRAEQVSDLAGLIHQRWVDPWFGESLAALSDSSLMQDQQGDAAATIRELKRQYEKRTKLPQKLVEELAHASVVGQQAWVEARQSNAFPMLAPHLERWVELKREQASAIGYEECVYDALLDDYEPGAKTSEVRRLLSNLCSQLAPLVQAIGESGRAPDRTVLNRFYPRDAQATFARNAAERIGFDFDRGRLDVTAHPFCTSLGPNDCRITTRYDEHDFANAFFGVLHEAGHGIYEQGLRQDQFGLPLGDAASLGVHESQSRLWENFVGRSRAFWQCFFPEAKRAFPQALSATSLDDFYFAINDVKASLIRTESDEATYNLHIIIRFELEQALVERELPVPDLPAAWREKYQRYLGIAVDRDSDGVLQDIHWSAGLFGYFPTYTLGNLYAAQLFDQAQRDLGDLDGPMSQGDFAGLKQWLHDKVHWHGHRMPASELVKQATGRSVGSEALLAHLRRKFGTLYKMA